jgi:hypothetical protein
MGLTWCLTCAAVFCDAGNHAPAGSVRSVAQVTVGM